MSFPQGEGQRNTGENVGGEKEVFKDKDGVKLRFRTLKEGANITITENADDIEITATDASQRDVASVAEINARTNNEKTISPLGLGGSDLQTFAINYVIGDGNSEIPIGLKGDLEIPFNCTIERVTMLADQTGSIVVDIFKDTFANYPPLVGDSITASAKPTISTALKSQDATLTGWTTSIVAGETLRYNVDSVTDIQRVTISLKCKRT